MIQEFDVFPEIDLRSYDDQESLLKVIGLASAYVEGRPRGYGYLCLAIEDLFLRPATYLVYEHLRAPFAPHLSPAAEFLNAQIANALTKSFKQNSDPHFVELQQGMVSYDGLNGWYYLNTLNETELADILKAYADLNSDGTAVVIEMGTPGIIGDKYRLFLDPPVMRNYRLEWLRRMEEQLV